MQEQENVADLMMILIKQQKMSNESNQRLKKIHRYSNAMTIANETTF